MDKNDGVWDSYIQSLETKADYSKSGILQDIQSIRREALEKVMILNSLHEYITLSILSESDYSNAFMVDIIDRLELLCNGSKLDDGGDDSSINSIGEIVSRIKIMQHIESQRKKREENEKNTNQETCA